MSLIFATGNQRKIAEAERVAKKYGVELESRALRIGEVQDRDPSKVVEAKARGAYKILGRPVVVNDASWSVPALNGFPGAYMHDVADWFAPEDWLRLMADRDDRSVVVQENVVFCDGEEIKCFQYSQVGRFADQPRGTGGNSIDKVAIFAADGRTIAECHDAGGHKTSSVALGAWEDFFEWYVNEDVK